MSPESIGKFDSEKSKDSKKKKRSGGFRVPVPREPNNEEKSAERTKKETRELASRLLGRPTEADAEKSAEKAAKKAENDERAKRAAEATEPLEPLPLTPELKELQEKLVHAIAEETDAGVKQSEAKSAEAEADSVEAVEQADAEQAAAEAAESATEKTIVHELDPNQLSGGETVIDLSGPVTEHIVPLRPEHPVEVPAIFKGRIKQPLSELRAQPEQQQQQQSAEASVPLELQNTPNTPVQSNPNVLPPDSSSPNVPPPFIPELYLNQNLPTQNANVLPTQPASSPNAFTQRDIEEAQYSARRDGARQGVIAGAIAGGAYEHFKHKRREKKTEKRFNEQTKKLEQTNENNNFTLAEQAKQNAETNRQLAATEQRATLAEQSFGTAVAAAPERVAAEQEKRFTTKQEQQRQRAEQEINQPERLDIPPDHRLETSAWHTIEVDSKTGKPVEQPAFEYGQEYHHERAQETRFAAQQNDTAKQAAAAALGGTLAGGASSATPSPQQPTDASQIPIATTQGPPTARLKDKAKAGMDTFNKSATSNAPIWPLVVVLFVIIAVILWLL